MLEQILDDLSLTAHRLWISTLGTFFVEEISKQIEKENWKDFARKDMWLEVIIPSEEQSVDEDRILLPFHPSYCIHSALHNINTSIYSIGAFEVQRSVLKELSYQLASKIFAFYRNFLNSIHQKQKILQEQSNHIGDKSDSFMNNTNDQAQTKNGGEAIDSSKNDSEARCIPNVGQEDNGSLNDLSKHNRANSISLSENNEISEAEILSERNGHDDNRNSQTKLISEEGYLQILFDIRFLGEIFIGVSFEKLQLKQHASSSLDFMTQIENDYVSLVEIVLSQIDPINWEIYEKAFVALVNECVIRNRLFVPLGTTKQYDAKKRKADSSILLELLDDSFLKLCNSGSHFNLLPIARRETKPTYANVLQEDISDISTLQMSNKQQKQTSNSVKGQPSGSLFSLVGWVMGHKSQ
jgi:hypothetical protein